MCLKKIKFESYKNYLVATQFAQQINYLRK